jgi:hypothetical protein
MSDPVTNVEIEDVLASIRRLVLEGATPPAPVVAAAPANTATRPEMSDRLVLTPALRVVEPRAPLAATATPIPEAERIPVAADAPDDVAGTDILPEPSDGDGAAERAGLIEAVLDARAEDWEPDGSEDVPVMDWSRTTPDDAPVFRSRHMAPLRLDRIVPPVEEPAFRHTPLPLPDMVETLASAVATDPDGLDAYVRGEAAAAQEDAELRAFLDRATVDEEMLRRIVTQVLQQELQGALGERITRNVRKLVRREINRALMDDQDI